MKDAILSSVVSETKSLYFILDLEIVGVHGEQQRDVWINDTDSRTIREDEWEQYDIMDKLYTNMDEIKLYRKLRYKWEIDNETLELFKTTQAKFDSAPFGNWKLFFYPYGSDGYTSLRLELYSMPILVQSIVAKVTFRYKNQSEYG